MFEGRINFRVMLRPQYFTINLMQKAIIGG